MVVILSKHATNDWSQRKRKQSYTSNWTSCATDGQTAKMRNLKNEPYIRNYLYSKAYPQAPKDKCCCGNCIMKLLKGDSTGNYGFGDDALAAAELHARERIYYRDQNVAHTELRTILERGYDHETGQIKTIFFHHGKLGKVNNDQKEGVRVGKRNYQ